MARVSYLYRRGATYYARIFDRVDLSVLRDPYTLGTKGQVRFIARKRAGADLTHADRFVKLRVAA